jgi:hypothetical protein
MKFGFVSLLANIPSLACCAAAWHLANESKAGWGWFLFIAVLISKSITTKKDVTKED